MPEITSTNPSAIELIEQLRGPKVVFMTIEQGTVFLNKVANKIEELQGQLIWGFYETDDGSPEYTQGSEKLHELHELVTADECNGLVKTIKALRVQKVELAEHLDKTIATAADAVNRMNTNEAEIARLQKILENCATSIQRLAFEMDPPNKFTPRFVQLAVGLRQASQARR